MPFRAVYQGFLVKEWAVESLKLWEEVDFFRTAFAQVVSAHPHALNRQSHVVFETFWGPNAVLPVNMSDTALRKMRAVCGHFESDDAQLTPDVFDRVLRRKSSTPCRGRSPATCTPTHAAFTAM